jgi:WD40 repeat protein
MMRPAATRSGGDPIRVGVMACLQFLKEQGLGASMTALETEYGCTLEAWRVDENNHLLNALAIKDQSRLAAETEEERAEQRELTEALQQMKVEGGGDPLVAHSDGTHEYVHRANVLACAFSPEPDATLIASAGADKTIKIFDYVSRQVVAEVVGLSTPALDVSWRPGHGGAGLLAAACMDGTTVLVENGVIVHKVKDHSKFAVRSRWSSCGRLLATSSRDHTLRLYALEGLELKSLKTFTFKGAVECLTWFAGSNLLAVGVRGDHRLHMVDASTLQLCGDFNLNETGDDHVSFTAIDVASSPCGQFLLVSTDHHRLIMLAVSSGKVVRSFYGALNDDYSNARCVWSLNGRRVYGTSQDRKVVCWDVGTAEVEGSLEGHKDQIRGLAHHPSQHLLASAAFDKTIRTWTSTEIKVEID